MKFPTILELAMFLLEVTKYTANSFHAYHQRWFETSKIRNNVVCTSTCEVAHGTVLALQGLNQCNNKNNYDFDGQKVSRALENCKYIKLSVQYYR